MHRVVLSATLTLLRSVQVFLPPTHTHTQREGERERPETEGGKEGGGVEEGEREPPDIHT